MKKPEIYYIPDLDQKLDGQTKELKPTEEQPGYKAALALKEILPAVKIVNPDPRLLQIKPDGADLHEWKQIDTPENILNYTYNERNHYGNDKKIETGYIEINQKPFQENEKGENNKSQINKSDNERIRHNDYKRDIIHEQKSIESTTTEGSDKTDTTRTTDIQYDNNENGEINDAEKKETKREVNEKEKVFKSKKGGGAEGGGKRNKNNYFDFEILGTDENRDSYFTDMGGYIRKFNTSTLTQTKLQTLAGMEFWSAHYPEKTKNGKIRWQDAINDINHIALNKDFNPDAICGVGAHVSDNGDISYNAGNKVYGIKDPDKFYIKKEKIDIGINSEHASPELLTKISSCVKKMEFGQESDYIRALSWSSTAAFGGALIKRPILYISGLSGSGKNELLDLIIRPISEPYKFLCDKITEPGIRRMVGYNSKPITINEFEKKKGANGKNMTDHRDAIWDAARGSYDNNDEIGVKAEGATGYVISRQSNSFCFSAIDPVIDGEANKNRSVQCSMKIREKNQRKRLERWEPIRDELEELMTKENCKKIRSLVWSKLALINKSTKIVKKLIQNQTGLPARDSERESIILATWMIAWLGMDEIIDNPITRKIINDYFETSSIETHQSEAENKLEILLDKNKIEVNGNDGREMLTVREALETVHRVEGARGTNTIEAEKSLLSAGIRYIKYDEQNKNPFGSQDYLVCIANKHQQIMKLMETGDGYKEYLKDTKHFININKATDGKMKYGYKLKIGAWSGKVTVLQGILDDKDNELGL